MLFQTLFFIFLFLPLTLLFSWIRIKPVRNTLLLSISIFFYAWGELQYIYIILVLTVFNYACALLYTKTRFPRLVLILSILTTLSFLIYHKYFHFLTGIFSFQLSKIPYLPLGISFFTFQLIAYQIDLYKKKIHPEKNIIDFSLYITFFPQLIAGPIVRYQSIIKRLKHPKLRLSEIYIGIVRFTIGLFKKVVLADTIGHVSDEIFSLPSTELWFGIAWLGAISFTFQLFFDFSGYTDMAIGLGKMMGFNFPENFKQPYSATSIREFWRRWHMTLSTWFRDYLYIPLGGNRKSIIRTILNLIIVFLVTGLWHGAGWTFVLWGLLHGIFLLIERFAIFKLNIPTFLKWLFTFSIIINLWVIFRALSIQHAFEFIYGMYRVNSTPFIHLEQFLNLRLILHLCIAILFLINFKSMKLRVLKLMCSLRLQKPYRIALFSFCMSIFYISVVYICTSSTQTFIYFRF